MCLSANVGCGGQNRPSDVKLVQILLNLNDDGSLVLPAPVVTDGICGSQTVAAIERFQRQVVGVRQPDGLIDPRGRTLRALHAGMPEALTAGKLHATMPDATPEDIERFHAPLLEGMRANGIVSPLRMAHFLAQVGHESADLSCTEERDSGDAYEGRGDLGNVYPGDGERYKGRGLIQLTGRANYRRYSTSCGVDYVSEPARLATDLASAVDVACWYWAARGLNALADADDLRQITCRINGGSNGLMERFERLRRTKWLLT